MRMTMMMMMLSREREEDHLQGLAVPQDRKDKEKTHRPVEIAIQQQAELFLP